MARLRFRVTTVHLDEDEEVEAIDAVVRDDTLVAVEGLIGPVRRASGNPAEAAPNSPPTSTPPRS